MNLKFYKNVALVATPIALQQLVISSLNMVDVFMISSLSNQSIAGVGAANKLYFIFNLFMFGMSSGSAILTAQYWGAKDYPNVKKVYGLTLTIGIIVSILFSLVAFFAPEFVIRFFDNNINVVVEGAKYLKITGFSYIFNGVSFAIVFVLRSTKEVRIPLYVSIIAIGLNTFLNWILIFGNLGFMAMGVVGAAIATLISRILEMVILLVICHIQQLAPSGKFSDIFCYGFDLVKKYLVIAGPTTANELLWATGVTMYAKVYGRMGTEVLSAMTIFQSIEQMVFVLIMGISNAAAIILGNTLGRGNLDNAYKQSKEFLKISLFIAIFLATVISLTAETTVSWFKVTDQVHQYIVNCLYVLAIVILPRTISTVNVVGILRSGGDTLFTAIVDGAGVWLIGVPFAFFTGLYLKWDVWFVLAALSMEEVFKSVITLWRVYSKKWLRNLTEEAKTVL